ncbi:MAG: c-type cytochrome [Phycisphaerales bacterium]|nr:c-type cytochrome [Phycisphaerales bacterium]
MTSAQVAVIRTTARRESIALGIAFALNAAVVVLAYVLVMGGTAVSVWLTPRPRPAYHERVFAKPAQEQIAAGVAEHGRDIFRTICAACHGPSGYGVQGLGRDLVHSDFVADLDDAALVAFLEQGRPADHPLNQTKVTMPPKGGNPALTAEDLKSVASFVRGMQDPRRMPELAPWAPKPVQVTQADKDAALAAAGGDAELAGYIASGNKIFHSVCVACHGQGGVGISGNGKPLVNNPFVQSLDDDGLLAFVKQGRAPSDPKNTTGIQMPPKGGNPAMSDDDILDVISYVRTLQPAKSVTQAGK